MARAEVLTRLTHDAAGVAGFVWAMGRLVTLVEVGVKDDTNVVTGRQTTVLDGALRVHAVVVLLADDAASMLTL